MCLEAHLDCRGSVRFSEGSQEFDDALVGRRVDVQENGWLASDHLTAVQHTRGSEPDIAGGDVTGQLADGRGICLSLFSAVFRVRRAIISR